MLQTPHSSCLERTNTLGVTKKSKNRLKSDSDGFLENRGARKNTHGRSTSTSNSTHTVMLLVSFPEHSDQRKNYKETPAIQVTAFVQRDFLYLISIVTRSFAQKPTPIQPSRTQPEQTVRTRRATCTASSWDDAPDSSAPMCKNEHRSPNLHQSQDTRVRRRNEKNLG